MKYWLIDGDNIIEVDVLKKEDKFEISNDQWKIKHTKSGKIEDVDPFWIISKKRIQGLVAYWNRKMEKHAHSEDDDISFIVRLYRIAYSKK